MTDRGSNDPETAGILAREEDEGLWDDDRRPSRAELAQDDREIAARRRRELAEPGNRYTKTGIPQ